MKNKEKQQRLVKDIKYKDVVFLEIVFFVIIMVVHKVIGEDLQHYFQKHDIKRTKAIVIDEKNYRGNQHVDFEYSYSYLFTVNGKQYTNDSHDYSLKIGDSVDIEYDNNWPKYNRLLQVKKEEDLLRKP